VALAPASHPAAASRAARLPERRLLLVLLLLLLVDGSSPALLPLRACTHTAECLRGVAEVALEVPMGILQDE
jgi:hypothetical protein